jgi:subtilase family serine protease
LFLASALLVHAASQPRITAPVDNSVRVRLNRSHLSINPASDLGAIDGARPFNRMFLVLNMAPEQQHELATLLDSQQTKGSPSYHRWLTPDEYAQRFGPAPEDLARIVAWLQQQGFSAIQPARSGMWIEFSGTVATVNRAFQTRIHAYQLGAETHIANSTDISIPSALSPLISGVPLHDFFSRPAFVRSPDRPAITNSAGAHAITPGDFATIYDLAPLYKANLTGAGQSIAIIARSDINLSDVTQFQKIFGLPSNVPQVIDNGIPPGVVPLGDGPEATLDTEWSAAVAPGAKIILVPSWDTATTDGVQLSASYIVDQNLAQIVNVSFTNCEQNLGTAGNAFWNNLWQQAAAQGMSVFVASGDSGASACAGTGLTGRLDDFAVEVNGLSSTPFNTSVGGTEFDETVNGGTPTTYWSSTNGPNLASAIGYIPEMVWNDIVSTGFVIVLGTGGGVPGHRGFRSGGRPQLGAGVRRCVYVERAG